MAKFNVNDLLLRIASMHLQRPLSELGVRDFSNLSDVIYMTRPTSHYDHVSQRLHAALGPGIYGVMGVTLHSYPFARDHDWHGHMEMECVFRERTMGRVVEHRILQPLRGRAP